MRFPGQIAAAIEVLADMEARHRPISEALRDWGLAHRFAGVADRSAIGNLVYDALRKRSSLAWRMGGDTPWHLVLGVAVLEWGEEPRGLNAAFATDRHAPPPLSEETIGAIASRDLATAPDHIRADLPVWLVPLFELAFGAVWVDEAAALAGRPPLDLRANTLKVDRARVAGQLARLGAVATPYSPVGLRIPPVHKGRRHPNVQVEESFQRGRFEVQDEGSQIAALLVGARPGEQVLDFCAGAGGKALALAARMENRGQIYAHDSDRGRLAPVFERLKRAGVRNVQVRPPGPNAMEGLEGQMDRVLVDAPCTGTGIWRRRPDAKWRVGPEGLEKRKSEQDAVLARAAAFVKPGGVLLYATCSVLAQENDERVSAFGAAHPHFQAIPAHELWSAALPEVTPPSATLSDTSLLLTPRRAATDGFFVAALRNVG